MQKKIEKRREFWTPYAEGAYNKVYINASSTLVFKTRLEETEETDEPSRCVRLWNEINPTLPPARLYTRYISPTKKEKGWVSPYIKGTICTDREIVQAVIEIYKRTGRIIIDAHHKNFVKTPAGDVVCIDVGLALQLDERMHSLSIVSQNAWRDKLYNTVFFLKNLNNRSLTYYSPEAVRAVKSLIFLKKSHPDLIDCSTLIQDPDASRRLIDGYDNLICLDVLTILITGTFKPKEFYSLLKVLIEFADPTLKHILENLKEELNVIPNTKQINAFRCTILKHYNIENIQRKIDKVNHDLIIKGFLSDDAESPEKVSQRRENIEFLEKRRIEIIQEGERELIEREQREKEAESERHRLDTEHERQRREAGQRRRNIEAEFEIQREAEDIIRLIKELYIDFASCSTLDELQNKQGSYKEYIADLKERTGQLKSLDHQKAINVQILNKEREIATQNHWKTQKIQTQNTLDKSGFWIQRNMVIDLKTELESKAERNERYNDAVTAADRLLTLIELTAQDYLNLKITGPMVKRLCLQAIDRAQDTFKEHRGYKQVLLDIASFFISVFTLFIPNMVIGQWRLFPAPTHSAEAGQRVYEEFRRMSLAN